MDWKDQHCSNDDDEFTEDVPFKSSSAAACIIAASSQNGRTTWKINDSGKTYGEWRDENIDVNVGIENDA